MKQNKYSKTAVLIAMAICLQNHDPALKPLINQMRFDYAYNTLKKLGLKYKIFLFLINYNWIRSIFYLVERKILKGILLHFLTRKKMIEQLVHQRLSEGAKQVVIFGAGFDGFGELVNKRFPDVGIYLVDHPGNNEKMNPVPKSTENINKIYCDLLQGETCELLINQGFDNNKPTIYLAEGLLMYLPPEAVVRFFDRIQALKSGGGSVIFTAMNKNECGSIQFFASSKWLNAGLSFVREPFLWGDTKRNILKLGANLGAKANVYDHVVLKDEVLKHYGLEAKDIARGEIIYEFKDDWLI